MTGTGGLEVISAGGRRERWRRSTVALVAVAVALAVALTWWVDRSARLAEWEALRTCVRDGDAAVGAALAPVQRVAEYVRPALRSGTPLSTRDGLYALVGEAASRAVGPVEQARARCARVRVRSWHDQQVRLQETAVAELDTLGSFLRAAEADGRTFYSAYPDVSGARARLDRAVEAARPRSW